MNDLLESIESTLRAGYTYPAFMSALCLPDICGYLSDPTEKNVGSRYEKWFVDYMPNNYSGYMSGQEAYGLRCQIQALLGHKDPKTINLWLRDPAS